MHGSDGRTGELFLYLDLEAQVRADHPVRVIRAVAKEALAAMGADFAQLSAGDRPPLDRARAATRDADADLRGEEGLTGHLAVELSCQLDA